MRTIGRNAMKGSTCVTWAASDSRGPEGGGRVPRRDRTLLGRGGYGHHVQGSRAADRRDTRRRRVLQGRRGDVQEVQGGPTGFGPDNDADCVPLVLPDENRQGNYSRFRATFTVSVAPN